MTIQDLELLIIIEHGQVKSVMVSDKDILLKTAVVDLDYMHWRNEPVITTKEIRRLDKNNLHFEFPETCPFNTFIKREVKMMHKPLKQSNKIVKLCPRGLPVNRYRNVGVASIMDNVDRSSIYRSINKNVFIKGYRYEYE